MASTEMGGTLVCVVVGEPSFGGCAGLPGRSPALPPAGEYEPAVNVVDLEDFGTQLVCGREVAGVFPRLTVQMDAALVSLAGLGEAA